MMGAMVKEKKVGDGEFEQGEYDGEIIHTFYKEEEPDKYFKGMNLFFKEKRLISSYRDGLNDIASYLEYITMKV